MTISRELKPKATYDFAAGSDYEYGDFMVSQKKVNVGGDVDARDPTGTSPTPMINLDARRFVLTVLVSLAVLVGVTVVLVRGVIIDTDVRDELGSSTNVDKWVETYQVIKGFVTAAFAMVMEGYFMVFIAVAATFLKNMRWFPGDDPRAGVGGNRVKLLLLWAFPPAILFVLNVAMSATFVGHNTTDVLRIFLKDDLVATKALTKKALTPANTANVTSFGNSVSVLDTILRGAVRQRVRPFEIDPDSKCTSDGSSDSLDEGKQPSVKEIRATAVIYGFPLLDWNADALPFGLLSTHNISFKLDDDEAVGDRLQERFDEFRTKADVSWLTVYELFYQGKLLFERSISDADASAAYPCSQVDSSLDNDFSNEMDGSSSGSNASESNATATITAPSKRRRLQEGDITEGGSDYDDEDYDIAWDEDSNFTDVFPDGTNAGKARCFGAISSLQDLADIKDPKLHTVDALIETMRKGFLKTADQIEPESMNLTIEVFDVNPNVRVTSMTIDMPYHKAEYRNTDQYCDADKQLRPEKLGEIFGDDKPSEADKKEAREVLCEQDSYPFLHPRTACGYTNCIFVDESRTISFKKQLQLMPYLTNYSAELEYNSDFHNFFPKNVSTSTNAVLLYGLGSYMSGDSFESGYDSGMPYISKPQRHVVLTFAKLEWHLQDLSKKFDASCDVNTTTSANPCMGLLHDLENVTVNAVKPKKGADVYKRVLVLGKNQLPEGLFKKDYRDPVQLVNLNWRPFYDEKVDDYYEWEYLDQARFNHSDWKETIAEHNGLTPDMCSPLVDSYIKQLDDNHLYIDDPRQPLYTSALYYLFQDAAIKTVKLVKNATAGAEILDYPMIGITPMKGDLERHVIKFSIPLPSLISTFVGLAFMVLLAVMAVVRPAPRLKMVEDTTESITHKYVRFHEEDEYPKEVFDRGLKVPTGERVAIDDYVVDSLTLHHTRDEDKKMYL